MQYNSLLLDGAGFKEAIVKRLGIILLITIGIFSSTTANSYYNSNSNIPMVDMMLTMMDVMSRMMRGTGYSNYSRYPYSPLPIAGLAMSPVNPYRSVLGGFSPNDPFLNNSTSNSSSSSHDSDTEEEQKTSFFGTNLDKVWESMENNRPSFKTADMNGIWQAISGDVIAIYNDYYFIWTDGNRRHLAGSLMIKGKQMVAYIPASKRYLKFQFYRENNKFAVRDNGGQIYIFKKIH